MTNWMSVVLESLTKAALVELTRGAGIAGSGLRKLEWVLTLSKAGFVGLAGILGTMSPDELNAACRAAGLNDSGPVGAVCTNTTRPPADVGRPAESDCAGAVQRGEG